MQRNQFTFYRSYYEAIRALPRRDQAAILLAVCAYALDEAEPDLEGTAKAIFTLIRPTLDAGKRKAESGMRGGRSRHRESKGEAEDRQGEVQAVGKQGPGEREAEIEKEVEEKMEIETEKEDKCPLSTPHSPPGGRRGVFSPPSVEEVRAYCRERNNRVDPQAFVDFYASKGWLIGKSPMRDWRAALRNWERSQYAQGSPDATRPQPHRPGEAEERARQDMERLRRRMYGEGGEHGHSTDRGTDGAL